MGAKEVIIKVIARLVVPFVAGAEVVLDAGRHLQRRGEALLEFRLQMDLVPCVVVVVSGDEGIVNVAENEGFRDAGEEGIAFAELGTHGGIGIHIILFHQQVPAVRPHADDGPVVTGVGLQDDVTGEFRLELRLAREFLVRAGPVDTVREEFRVQVQVGQVGVEREAALLEGFGAADVPVHEGGADAQLVARGHVGGFHRQDGRERLSVFAAVTAQGEAHSLEQERREAAPLVLALHVRAVRDKDVHAVHEGLALLAFAAADIEFSILPYLLGAGQDLERGHDVSAGIAGHHDVEGVHGLDPVALADAVGARRHDDLVDGGGLLAQAEFHIIKFGGVGHEGFVLIAQHRRA